MPMSQLKVDLFHLACQNIVDNENEKSLNYAVNYASYGLILGTYDEAEIKIQALYILNNMTKWRGDVAKETRLILKSMKEEN